MNRIFMMWVILVAMTFTAFADESAIVDGITWRYRVVGGKAELYSSGIGIPVIPALTTGAITIPSFLGGYPVTGIGYNAFSRCSKLTAVTIPSSVTYIDDCAFYDCDGLTSLTIPGSVTNIGSRAFYDCTFLASITLPDSVTRIGYETFFGCSGLASVTIPKSVTNIENSVFSGCSSLVSVTIPNGVTSIGNSAFYGCSALTTMTIPSGVMSIGSYAFKGCSGLTSVTISDGVAHIGEFAFSYCKSLVSVTIPPSVTNIEDSAFEHCTGLTAIDVANGNAYYASQDGVLFDKAKTTLVCCPVGKNVTSYVVPSSVTRIGSYAFYWCSTLASVTIPPSVTSVGESAFGVCSALRCATVPGRKCGIDFSSVTNLVISEGTLSIERQAFSSCGNLVSVKMPSSVTSIGELAFDGCSRLMSFEVSEGNPNFRSINGCLCTKDGRTLLNGINGDVTIPSSVTSIGSSAFRGYRGLATVTIPDSVTSIGSSAFYGCSGLTTVAIPDGVTSIESCVFYDCSGLISVTMPNGVTSIGNSAFARCRDLAAVTIPPSVTNIDAYAFYDCSAFTSMVVPDSVTNIGELAFCGCSSLTSVTIPYSVKRIGGRVFDGCNSIKDVEVPGWKCGIDFSSVTNLVIADGTTSIDNQAFESCGGLTSVMIPDSVTSIRDRAFYGCSGVTSLTIPNSVTNIGSSVFYGCSGLTSVMIPDHVTRIGNDVFYGCSGLTSVTIPSSVTSIGERAFYGCSALTSVAIPNDVTHIKGGAFHDCSRLTSVTIPEGVEIIGWGAFHGCSGLTSVVISNGVKIIAPEAFRSCSGLTSLTIPGSVTNIMDSAFRSCSGLTSVTLSDGVMSIDEWAFGGCGNLASVTVPDSVTSVGRYAFYGCSRLKEVIFEGNAPAVGNYAFSSVSSDCVVRVKRGSTGWNVDIPGTWKGLPIDYVKPKYEVMFDVGDKGVRVSGGELIQNVVEGMTPVAPVVQPNTGWEFRGWDGDVTAAVYGSVEFHALWSPISYQVTFDLGGKGVRTGGGTLSQSVDYGSAAVAPVVSANRGWEFLGWDRAFSSIDGDTTVEAQWRRAYDPEDFSAVGGWTTGATGSGGVAGYDDATATGGKSLKLTTSDDNETWVELSVTNGVRVSFDCKVSCEAYHKGYWDYLQFSIDGIEQFKISGETGWGSHEYEIAVAGEHKFRWTYVKDESVGEGEDCAWIANVQIVEIPIPYTMTFDAVGGTVVMSSKGLIHGSQVGALPIPAKTGFDFAGWFTSAAGGVQVTSTTVAVGNMTVYAHWTTPRLNLTVTSTYGNANGSGLYDYGSSVELYAPDPVTIGGCTQYICTGSAAYPDSGTTINLTMLDDLTVSWDVWTTNYLVTIEQPEHGTISGVTTGWRADGAEIVLAAIPDSKYAFVEWTGDVDGCVTDGDRITVPVNRARSVSARFKRVWTVSEALNAEGLVFTNGGSADWRFDDVVTHDGVAAMRSGSIIDSQTSDLILSISGRGTLSFWWKASSETYKKNLIDYGEVLVDGVSKGQIGGEADWQNVELELTSDGPHVITWRYVKDETDSAGQDCAWLDQVVWTPREAIPGLPNDAAQQQVSAALEGSADTKLQENISNGEAYNAYRTWANAVKNSGGTAAAGQQAVKDSPNAWLSFALDSDKLIGTAPSEGDVKIDEFKSAAEPGTFDFEVSIEDIEVGEGATEENLKKVLGVEGAETLDAATFSPDNVSVSAAAPHNGKVKFTVGPKNVNAKSMFIRAKMK